MNIGIDLDNVLADFQTTWLEFHNTHYGTALANEDVTNYDYGPIIGIPPEEVVRRIYEFYDSAEFEDIVPEPGAADAVKTLSGKYGLYIVTSRPDRTANRTNKWIDTYLGGLIDEVILTNQFSTDHDGKITKATICKKYKIPLFIEDGPKYVDEVAHAGIPVLLLDQPWNQKVEESERVIRVRDWDEIVKEVGRLSEEK